MGALCCCLSSDAFEDYLPYQNGTFIQDYFCFRCCLPWFSNTVFSPSGFLPPSFWSQSWLCLIVDFGGINFHGFLELPRGSLHALHFASRLLTHSGFEVAGKLPAIIRNLFGELFILVEKSSLVCVCLYTRLCFGECCHSVSFLKALILLVLSHLKCLNCLGCSVKVNFRVDCKFCCWLLDSRNACLWADMPWAERQKPSSSRGRSLVTF